VAIRLGCVTICFRTSPIEEALKEIRNAGFSVLDLAIIPGFCPHYDAATTPEAQWPAFIELIKESGLQVPTVTCVPGDFNAEDADFDAIVRAGMANSKLATRLGARYLNINCGKAINDRSRFREHALHCAKGIKRIAQDAADMGIRITVEVPHRNRLARTLDEAEFMMEAIGEDNVYYLIDSSHTLAGGDQPHRAIRRFGERVGHVHLRDAKDEEIFLVPGDGEVDFRTFFDSLLEIHYPGVCALELEGVGETLPERRDAVLRSIRCLRTQTEGLQGLSSGTAH
jgi:sugar phosphate isomerase/epimerase